VDGQTADDSSRETEAPYCPGRICAVRRPL